ncbi:MAG: hypothetical protein NXI12_09050 [Alphaproteobacteria bacterium]|nr:hypothetical protein [Alphaproteobacteria bacterium]
MRKDAKIATGFGRAAGIGAACAALAACTGEGQAPQTTLIGEDEVAVHRLVDLTDPYGDLFIAPERGLFIDFGRAEPIITCERRGYICTEWPFVFSFPEDGEAPTGTWTAGAYEFEVIAEAERDFCGRTRTAYLVEGSNDVGWSTRVWYRPDFGVYAVMSGQARDGELVTIERAFTTCDRGLFARSGGLFRRAGTDE